LLERGAANPAGNLRVHPPRASAFRAHPGFALEQMIERGDAFIDYAYEVGATVAGSTDTQGEAPKFWVAQDLQGRWHPDNGQLGAGGTTFSCCLPEQILSAGVQSVAAGDSHTLIVKTDGSLWAMGDNWGGDLGDGTTTRHESPEQIFSGAVLAVAAGTCSRG